MNLGSKVRSGWWLALPLAGLGALYLRTMSRYVLPGDPAEFVTVVATFGLAHPTGYPLYVVAARAWMLATSFVPPEMAVNAFSLACGLGLLLLVGGAARACGVSPGATVVALLLLGTTRSAWRFSLHAEVYTFHALLVAGLLLAIARGSTSLASVSPNARPASGRRHLVLAFYLAGLGLGAHMTSLLLLPGLVFLVATGPSAVTRQRLATVALCCGFFALGATCLLVVPLLDRPDRLNYYRGLEALYPDLTPDATWKRLRYILTASQFRAGAGVLPALASGQTFANLGQVLVRLLEDGGSILALGIAGLVLPFPAERRNHAASHDLHGGVDRTKSHDLRTVRVFIALGLVGWCLYLSTYLTFFQPVFFLGVYALLAVAVANIAHRGFRSGRLRRVTLLLAAAAIAWQLRVNFDVNDLARESEYQIKSGALLATFEPNAVVFSTWTYSTLFWFHQWVRGVNPTVETINAVPTDWVVKANTYTERPLYFERVPPGAHPNRFVPASWFYKLRDPGSR